MTSDEPLDPTVFEDTDHQKIILSEDDLLGTHTYSNVLYTGETNIINVLTGETPSNLDKSIEEAKEFVAKMEDDEKPPRVAKAQNGERAVESRSPYLRSPFFHKDITGNMEWHTVFRKAWESDAYTVTHTTDYETGTLTITVTVADNYMET